MIADAKQIKTGPNSKMTRSTHIVKMEMDESIMLSLKLKRRLPNKLKLRRLDDVDKLIELAPVAIFPPFFIIKKRGNVFRHIKGFLFIIYYKGKLL